MKRLVLVCRCGCPTAASLIEELEKLAKEMEDKAGYERVRTPHLTKEDLFLRSVGTCPIMPRACIRRWNSKA
jgi:hypothetical protein